MACCLVIGKVDLWKRHIADNTGHKSEDTREIDFCGSDPYCRGNCIIRVSTALQDVKGINSIWPVRSLVKPRSATWRVRILFDNTLYASSALAFHFERQGRMYGGRSTA